MAEEKEREESGKISRREFIKDAGLVVGGAAVGSMALVNACGGGDGETTKTVINTMTKTVTGGASATSTVTVTSPPITPVVEAATAANMVKLTIDGGTYELHVQPQWSLQHLLHDVLQLTSVKDMCTGYGACGACTVILEGRPVLSCMALAIECDGMHIETAQGIAKSKHPIIESYTTFHTNQCGYCTPGFVVTAKALLDRNSKPTETDIREALSGNLCRCATYPQHILAVLDAAKKTAGGV